jgi:DNA polymerase I-like protein with 3'-5' exonuclease and polymerase domains
MQNVPAHDERGRMFRAAFTADEGHLLVAADYSQVRQQQTLLVVAAVEILWQQACSSSATHHPHWNAGEASDDHKVTTLARGGLTIQNCCQLSAATHLCVLQVELRVMAALSGDEALLQAFAEGQDVHAATAREVLGKGPQVRVGSWPRMTPA